MAKSKPKIATKPLSPKDQDDRSRIVFGQTSNGPLPDVDDETLAACRDYLVKSLTFPFQARHGGEYGLRVTHWTWGIPPSFAGRGPGAGQWNLRSCDSIGTSLMLASRRRINP